MAFGAGKNGVLKLDATNGGSLTDYSAYVTNVSWSRPIELLDTTTLSKNSHTRIKGLKDATFTIDFNADPTFIDVLESHDAGTASTSFEYDPMGTTSGQPKYTGECFLGEWSFTTSVDGVVTGSASFSCSDDVTPGAN